MSLASFFKEHKAIIVHTLSVAGIVAANAADTAKTSGNKTAIMGLTMAASMFHLGEGLAKGTGLSGAGGAMSEAAGALKDLIGNATAARGAANPVA